MLNINPDIIREIINKAREFQAQEAPSVPLREPFSSPDSPDAPYEEDWTQMLASHSEDLTYQEARTAIHKLEPDQQITLIALMYLGRGDYSKQEWKEAIAEAKYHWTPDNTARQLLSQPQITNYLEEGLLQFGYSI